MSNLNNLSPQELSCISEVQKAPEAQRQKIFEKACNAITDKTRIALLAATLSLSSPAMAQNISETNPNYESFYTQIVERNPKLSPEQYHFFTTLYVEGLKVIDPKNERVFGANIRQIASAVEVESVAMGVLERMIQRGILPENHTYTQTLKQIIIEIDKVGQENLTRINNNIQQAREQQQQAREQQQQAREQQQQAREQQQQAREQQQQYNEARKRRQELAKRFQNI